MKQLKLKVNQSTNFTNFLKKFSSIDGLLLIELSPTVLKAKTHTPERSVVKYSSTSVDEIFSEHEIKDEIKIGIQNIDKLAQSFKYFGEGEFDFIINVDKVQDQYVGTEIIMKNSSLDITFKCASLKMFTFITDDILSKITATENSDVDFLLPKEQQSKIISLFGIDTDYSKISFTIDKNSIIAKGRNFNYEVSSDDSANEAAEISVFKHHYQYLDREDTQVYLVGDQLILLSNETDTKLVIGQAE